MRRTFKLDELDCANCAAKMEEAIAKLPGVKKVSVNFMAQKMILEAEDSEFDEVLRQAAETIAKVEPDCHIVL
ncbi:MAG: heavy-metal-associated domain-containing protein [Clostridiales bacterium]|nr:heavy-metal-associated domain-containing protein [Clostridiales bacterium]